MKSLQQSVIAKVRELGTATADDISIEGYSRDQIIKALQNAKLGGWLDSIGHVPKRGQGCGRGSTPTTYFPTTRREVPAPIRLLKRQIPSVWALGERM